MADCANSEILLIHAEQLDEKLKNIEENKLFLMEWSDQENMRAIIREWKTNKRKEIKNEEKKRKNDLCR